MRFIFRALPSSAAAPKIVKILQTRCAIFRGGFERRHRSDVMFGDAPSEA